MPRDRGKVEDRPCSGPTAEAMWLGLRDMRHVATVSNHIQNWPCQGREQQFRIYVCSG